MHDNLIFMGRTLIEGKKDLQKSAWHQVIGFKLSLRVIFSKEFNSAIPEEWKFIYFFIFI